MVASWLFMQMVDSAFPTGGFAHSEGLEAAWQLGEITGVSGLEKFLQEALWQAGYGQLPFANDAYVDSSRLNELDDYCHAYLTSTVANRASRVQGRTFLATCLRTFAPANPLSGLKEQFTLFHKPLPEQTFHQHFAPIFGAVMAALELPRTEMQQLLLFNVLRGILSAAVRLGIVGPYQAGQIQFTFSRSLTEVLHQCSELTVSELAQTAPLLEVFQSLHDRMYSKLFQS